jgi:hypothetical protein
MYDTPEYRERFGLFGAINKDVGIHSLRHSYATRGSHFM